MPQLLERDIIEFPPAALAPKPIRLPVALPDLVQRYETGRSRICLMMSLALHGLGLAVFLSGAWVKTDYGISDGTSGLIAIEMVDSIPTPVIPTPAHVIPPKPIPSPEDVALKTQKMPEMPAPPVVQAASPSPAKATGDGGAALALPGYYSNPPPPYPMAAREQKQQGRVLLEVRVNKLGRPEGVRIKESSGFPLLDEAALAAVQKWRFKPARLAGITVETVVEVPIRFQLKNKNA